jgi:hypothetical protein
VLIGVLRTGTGRSVIGGVVVGVAGWAGTGSGRSVIGGVGEMVVGGVTGWAGMTVPCGTPGWLGTGTMNVQPAITPWSSIGFGITVWSCVSCTSYVPGGSGPRL